MSWDEYITNLKSEEALIMEAAIWGHDKDCQSVWATSQGLSAITACEIKHMCGDLSEAFTNGLKIGGMKCTLLRNGWEDSESLSMILSTKIKGQTHAVCVGKSQKAYVIVLSQPGVKVGQMLPSVHKVVKYLRDVGY